HLLVVLPLLGRIETPKPLPTSISEAVLKNKGIVAGIIGAMALLGLLASGQSARAEDAHETPRPPAQKWSFAGPFGKFDRGQLQRGFKVYREVCSNCHGIQLLSFRNLAEPGGPGFSMAQ